MSLTATQLRKLLLYMPDSGEFVNLTSRTNRKAGTIAWREVDRHGRRRMYVEGKRYLAHRLAWLWMTGAWPRTTIDHVNRDPSDNSWLNLREATRKEQQQNRGLNRNNTSGFKGVVRVRYGRGFRWRAQIERSVCGKRKTHYLGFFHTIEEASLARESVERVMFPFSPLNQRK